jgi:prepilin-type N-terminal cleavage/methylation domain-containing protein
MFRYKRKGMTLIEVMVALFVSTIVLTAIYGVWIRVQRQIARSHAKQTLESELRKASNNMEKDFKAIKEGTFEAPPADQSEDGTAMKIRFERFDETEEGKIAQDSTINVEYELKNGLLKRTTDDSLKILSSHVDTVTIVRSVDEDALEATDLEATDEDFKAGREAMLDIEIAGKKRIAGSKKEMFHIERTSLVMRDEYYKNTNKTYVSNFDLAQMETAEVMQEDTSQDASFGPGGNFSLEELMSLDDEQLSGMKLAQEDLLEQANNTFDKINEEINNIDTGNGWLDTLNIFSTSEGEKVEDMQDDLEDADTKEETEAAVAALQDYADKKEEQFLADSISGYSSLSDEEKQLYKQAYDMKVQDRTIKQINEDMADEDGFEPVDLMIDVATGNTGESNDQTYKDEEGDQVLEGNEDSEEVQSLKDAYDSIDLSWMGDPGDESEEVQAYNAAKILVNLVLSKLDTIDMRDTAQDNIEKIDTAMGSN